MRGGGDAPVGLTAMYFDTHAHLDLDPLRDAEADVVRRAPGSYLIVSHGGLLNQLMHAIVGIAPHVDPSGVRFRFENTAFARVIYYPYQHRWSIDALNDYTHLKPLKLG